MYIPYEILSKEAAEKLRGNAYEPGIIPGFRLTKRGVTFPPISIQRVYDNVPDSVKKYLCTDQWDDVWNEYAEVDDVVAMSYATTSDYYPPHPDGLEYYPFQRAGIEYAAFAPGALIADDMGLGKTVQAIGVCNVRKHETVVVVCPLSVKLHWVDMFKKWLTYDVQKVIDISTQTPSAVFLTPGVFVINYDILARLWGTDEKKGPMRALKKIDALILDESHSVRNFSAGRTKAALALSKKASQRLLLTGTPIENRPRDIYFQAKIAGPDVFNNSEFFKHRYCGPKLDKYGNWSFDGVSNSDELSRLLRGTIMIRRTKESVLADLPKKTRTTIKLAPSDDQKSLLTQYRKLLNHYQSQVDNGLYEAALASIQKDETYAAMRRSLGETKVISCAKFVEELLENVSKVVVFTYHRSVLEALQKMWKDSAVHIQGGDDDSERQQAINKFITIDKIRIMIISIMAGGTGLDGLQKVCSTAVFCELPYNPSTLEQAEDRLHRIGQNSHVDVYHLLVDNSCDTTVHQLLTVKQKRADRALK